MNSLDIDTRTDIYALGVLLYELLTGQTPFDTRELMAAGLDAMRRIIREQEPVRPSTRLSTMLAADLATVARTRQAEPARLGSLFRGDLDWIVMKALEKDRARRYETANGLMRDVERYLADEPVVARPHIGKVEEAEKYPRTHDANLVESETCCRRALVTTRKLLGNDNLKAARAINILANVRATQYEMAEAEKVNREALALRGKVLANDSGAAAWTLSSLASLLEEQGRLEEAEAFAREALESTIKQGDDRVDSLTDPLDQIVRLLLTQHKDLQAQQLFDEVLKRTGEGQSANVGILRVRSSLFARHGRWKQAANVSSQLVDLDGSDDYDAFKLTVLFAEIGDVANFRASCHRMMARYAAGKDPGPLDKTAKVSLLLTNAGIDLAAACRMADQAVILGKDSPWVYYFQFGKGLAQYRAGQFASAVDWVGKSIGQPATVGESSPDWNRDAAAYSMLAMAQHRLTRAEEAHTALAKAADIVNRRLPKLENSTLQDNWADWLIAHIFLREAQGLLAPTIASNSGGSEARNPGFQRNQSSPMAQ